MRTDRFDGREMKDRLRRNEQIRIPQVLVIQNGQNLGVMSNRAALALAQEEGLDLVEVSPAARPPVCHITDYGKLMFERQKKKKDKQTGGASSAGKEKEVVFRYVTDDHDLNTKANQIRRFVEQGFRVRCVCRYRRRENAHKDQGIDLLNKLVEMLQDIAVPEFPPKLEGSSAMVRLVDKKKETKKN